MNTPQHPEAQRLQPHAPAKNAKLEPISPKVLLWVKTVFLVGIAALMLAAVVWAFQVGSALYIALSLLAFALSSLLLHRSRHILRRAVGLEKGNHEH